MSLLCCYGMTMVVVGTGRRGCCVVWVRLLVRTDCERGLRLVGVMSVSVQLRMLPAAVGGVMVLVGSVMDGRAVVVSR